MARRRAARRNPGTALKAVAQDLCGLRLKNAGSWEEDDRKVRAFKSNPFDQLGDRQVAMSMEALQGIYDAIPFGERIELSDGRYGIVDIFYPPQWDDQDATTGAASFGIDVDLFKPSGERDGHIEFIVRQEGWEVPVAGRRNNPGALATTIIVLAAAGTGYLWGRYSADPRQRFERAMGEAQAAVREQDWPAATEGLAAAWDAMGPAYSESALRQMESLNSTLPQRDRLIAIEDFRETGRAYNPDEEGWTQLGEDTYEAYFGDLLVRVDRDHTSGLRDGGRWHWTITEDGWTHESGTGFRSRKAATEDLRKTVRADNPMAGMPGGSVKGCIKKMKRRKKPPRDAGAYCASIADQIEPGWREENPPGVYVVPTSLKSGRALRKLGREQGFAVGEVTETRSGTPFTKTAYYVVSPDPAGDVAFWLGEYGVTGWWNEDANPHKWRELLLDDGSPRTVDPYVVGIIRDVDENPRKTSRRTLLPRKMGDVTYIGYGRDFDERTLHVKKTRRDTYVLKVEGESRVRFGNKAQALEDIAHFKETGALPREKTSWANNPDSIVFDVVQVGPGTYNIKIGGKAGRTPVRGELRTFSPGMYDHPDDRKFFKIANYMHLVRDTDRGGTVPHGARLKVQKALAAKLEELRVETAEKGDPEWRSNPGFVPGLLLGSAIGWGVPKIVGSMQLQLTEAEPTRFTWESGSDRIVALALDDAWDFTVILKGERLDSRLFPFDMRNEDEDEFQLSWERGLVWATERLNEGPRKSNPDSSRRLEVRRR